MKRAAIALAFTLVSVHLRADTASALDEYFSRLAAHGYSGAVLVAHGEDVILRKGYGLADKRTGTPVTPETVFSIASLDKQFIAAGILRLQEMGKLKVSDTLDRFFDFVPADKRGITLHQVLSHTAGFSDEYWDEHDTLSRADFIKWVLTNRPLIAAPGARSSYVSFDYWLLEEVITRVAEMPFERFLNREFFAPNGMTQTGFTEPAWDAAKVAHYQLWTLPDEVLRGDGHYTNPLLRPAAHRVLLSTVDDLHRWYLAMRGGKVLTADSRRSWWTPVMAGYAYGWNVVSTPRGTKLIHHGGGGGVTGSVVTFRWYVDEDVLVVIFNNAIVTGFNADYVMADVDEIVFGGGGTMPPPSVPRAADAAVEGSYRLPHGGVIEVIRAPNGGPLVARSQPPEGIAALRMGGTEGSSTLSDEPGAAKAREWAAEYVTDAGALQTIDVMHTRSFFYEGRYELQSYLKLQFEKRAAYLRAVHDIGGRVAVDVVRLGEGIEAVLAPSPLGGYTTWEPRFGGGVRVDFSPKGMRITGDRGSVLAERITR